MSNSILYGGGFPRPLPFPQPLPAPSPFPSTTPGADSARRASTQGQQIDSIRQGLSSGALSESEASNLLNQQSQIANAMTRAYADGTVSALERLQLDAMQSRAGRDLFEAQNNCQRGYQAMLDPTTTAKQVEQLGSIAQGIRGGDLSSNEASTLLGKQAGIAKDASEIQSDWKVDSLERFELKMKQYDAQEGIDGINNYRTNRETAPHGRLSFPQLFF